MHSDNPLISCIMPTRDRQQWAAEAVDMFHAQTYPNKELVIVDDLMERSFPCGVESSDVQYNAVPRLSIGGKRNLAVSRAAGDIIAHWDSDGIYSPDRLEFQASMLVSHLDLVGFHRMEFRDAESDQRWMYHASPGFPIGVSLMYWRRTWEARRFQNVDCGEGVEFAQFRSVACVPADGRIIARVHTGNTSEKRGPIAQNPAQWRVIT